MTTHPERPSVDASLFRTPLGNAEPSWNQAAAANQLDDAGKRILPPRDRVRNATRSRLVAPSPGSRCVFRSRGTSHRSRWFASAAWFHDGSSSPRLCTPR